MRRCNMRIARTFMVSSRSLTLVEISPQLRGGGGGKLSNKLNGQIKWSNENNCQIRSGRASPREDLPAEEAAAVSCTQIRKTYVYSISCRDIYIYIYIYVCTARSPGHVDPHMTRI